MVAATLRRIMVEKGIFESKKIKKRKKDHKLHENASHFIDFLAIISICEYFSLLAGCKV